MNPRATNIADISVQLMASVALTSRDQETAAFTLRLFGRKIGVAAEIDDHLSRGRNMEKRTPATASGHVL